MVDEVDVRGGAQHRLPHLSGVLDLGDMVRLDHDADRGDRRERDAARHLRRGPVQLRRQTGQLGTVLVAGGDEQRDVAAADLGRFRLHRGGGRCLSVASAGAEDQKKSEDESAVNDEASSSRVRRVRASSRTSGPTSSEMRAGKPCTSTGSMDSLPQPSGPTHRLLRLLRSAAGGAKTRSAPPLTHRQRNNTRPKASLHISSLQVCRQEIYYTFFLFNCTRKRFMPRASASRKARRKK